VDVLRLPGRARCESHPAMARWFASEGQGKNRYQTAAYASHDGLAGTLGQRTDGLAKINRTAYWSQRGCLSPIGILRTREAGVHDCPRSYGERETTDKSFGGRG
jgi:hypothetical protein